MTEIRLSPMAARMKQRAEEPTTGHMPTSDSAITHAQVTNGTEPSPGNCEQCPACGYWDAPLSGSGRYCSYEAYFLGKSAKAKLADHRRGNCPLNEED